MHFTIKKGLDLPITGAPLQEVFSGPHISRVALLGREYNDLKPQMSVAEGDIVAKGQTLFINKKNPAVQYVSPASGVVESINRGARRVFRSIVIRAEGDAERTFDQHDPLQPGLDRTGIEQRLLDSGLWLSFRTRPYSKAPVPGATPHSIFVTAIDTRPLAANPAVVLEAYQQDFKDGLHILTHLTEGQVHVCVAPAANISVPEHRQIQKTEFAGLHPAGLPGTHIHFLDPVHAGKQVWHLNYQDVVAIGKLFTTGRIWTERVISLAGPAVRTPRLIRTIMGASTEDLVADELVEGECRVISGSVFAGWRAAGWASYLGRYGLQVSVLREGRERELFGWLAPGLNKFSKTNTLLSSLFRNSRKFDFTTSQNGSPRAMVPIGVYEEVMPLDILPTQLLRALLVKDTDLAQALGCLELDEEDLSLCTFVCPSKYEYGPVLRANLGQIEREG